ncbi:MAG: nuclear transport factor 2 family protein [Candidatus Deferrimicrobium sp.]
MDKMAVKEAFARYAITMDTGAADGFADVFTEDAFWRWETEAFKVVFRGRKELRDMAALVARSCPGSQHMTGNHVVDIQGGKAHAICELMVSISRPEAIYPVMQGFYDADLVKIGEKWFISELRVQVQNPEILLQGKIGEYWAGIRDYLLK